MPSSTTNYKLHQQDDKRSVKTLASAGSSYRQRMESFRLQASKRDGIVADNELLSNNIYLTEETRRQIDSMPDLSEDEVIIIQRLAMKSFHLPGNTFWQDWSMFVNNNHIILSFFFSHPLHPFGRKERFLNLVASLAFGLAATSCVQLWYFYHANKDKNEVVVAWQEYCITSEMWTTAIFGGLCNVMFDFSIWFVQACPPCQPGGLLADKISYHARFFWLWVGSNAAFIITTLAICLAIQVIVVRASVIDDGNDEGYSDSIKDYSFLASYALEVVFTQFICFPLVAGTIFSGIFGCFRLPGIGGRPYQVRRLRQKRQQMEMSDFDFSLGPGMAQI